MKKRVFNKSWSLFGKKRVSPPRAKRGLTGLCTLASLRRSSPFSSFTKSLPQEKKKPFMEVRHARTASLHLPACSFGRGGGSDSLRLPSLARQLMKRLRGAKSATQGTKDEKKKVMGALDADIHKLLGTEYKRYRTVQHAQHEMHTSLKKGMPPASTLATTSISPPPPASASPGKKGTGSLKKGLPGSALKKKKAATVGGLPSTTVG